MRDRFQRNLMILGLLLQAGGGPALAQDDVPGPDAVSRIEQFLKEVNDAKTTMRSRADYTDSESELSRAMQAAGVSQVAIEKYAKDWAQGYVYMSWSWVQPFYDAHARALSESLALVRGARVVPAGDVEYLERGMSAWRGAEGEVQLLFDQLIQALVQRGAYLGRSLELSDRKHKESECCGQEWQEFEVQIEEQDIHATERSMDAQYASTVVREYGDDRYFSAIAPPFDVVAEDDEDSQEECEDEPLDDGLEDMADLLGEIQAAYDASEESSYEFLRNAEESFNARNPPFAQPAE